MEVCLKVPKLAKFIVQMEVAAIANKTAPWHKHVQVLRLLIDADLVFAPVTNSNVFKSTETPSLSPTNLTQPTAISFLDKTQASNSSDVRMVPADLLNLTTSQRLTQAVALLS